MPSTRFTRLVLSLLLAGCAAIPAAAQEPHEAYKNLKVLPRNISQRDLDATMNGFTRALGVRCIYCHVGTEGKPFRREDFQLDDKPTKLKARIMLGMVKDINEKYLSKLEKRAEPPIQV